MHYAKLFRSAGLCLALLSLVVIFCVGQARATVSAYTVGNFDAAPESLAGGVAPRLMINTSKDQQLFFKAYNDYTDLNSDGIPETTYTHSIDYYGYFDSYKCYEYDAVNARYKPKAVTADKYCAGGNDMYWSGNFLNWATMSRIDTIRKILFGGHRRVDTAALTVLERSYLPTDIHAFAKFYAGADLAKLTPYAPNSLAPSYASATSLAIGSGSKTLTIATNALIKTGDYVKILNDASNSMRGWVTGYDSATGLLTVDVAATNGAGTEASWTVTNLTRIGITICNTTWDNSNYSQNVTNPPLMRVAEGNYSFWAAGEVVQCSWSTETADANHGKNYNNPETSGIYAAQGRPVKADVGSAANYGDFNVRVVACDSTLLGQENCKLYPSGNYKPVGLLQTFGDNDSIQFGMIAGTYGKHLSGGDLVYDIGSMSREINVATNGTFKLVSSDIGGTANPNNASEGMINAWSLYRIYGYKHGSWNYTQGAAGGDNCGVDYFPDAGNTKCANWGNPFAEIYQTSLFYFGGENSPNEYTSNDTTYISGLRYETGVWADHLNSNNYCARLFVLNFNSSVISVDDDQLDTAAYGVQKTLGSVKTSDQLTNDVGTGEGLHGNHYFVGQNGMDNNQRCTDKTVSGLGSALGMCPEGPDLKGSFRIAGLAYYAHTNDIRPTTYPNNGNNNPNGLKGSQTVETYAVALSSGAPTMSIPIPGSANKVTLLPACINNNRANHSCTLVDFKVLQQHSEVAGVGTGKFLAIWEDAIQGSDYDLDAGGIYSYRITSTQIEVSTAVTLENLGHAIGHGYIIGGTTKDGLHIHSGTNNFNYVDPTAVTGCVNCIGPQDGGGATTTVTYPIGASSAGLLKDPLWYAAKWGGFEDRNGNNKPDLQSEWDKKNRLGQNMPDGIPDNYFLATNPTELEQSLQRVFLSILERVSSGTAAAVVSNNVSGVGALYQAYYEPLRQDAEARKASWLGTVHALWLDDKGLIREDNNGNGILDNYQTDMVIESYYDAGDEKTKIKRWSSSSASDFTQASYLAVNIDEVKPLWNAREQLYFSLATDLVTQRTYGLAANQGRHIKTWIDGDRDGLVGVGEFVDFTDTSVSPSNYGFFDLATQVEAQTLVKYIRGKETTGYRSRTIDYNNDGTTEVMRLGDIVNSTPTVVGSPLEAFDLLYKDTTYGAFRAQYKNRRQVLYVGANDGMLHALNAGFYKPQLKQISVTGQKCSDGSAAVAHPLGSELWAYVPFNLLPHLKWLKDPNYPHVYYVDGKPRVFDARIFSEDAAHPNGWGTVMVVGMRLGGGKMRIDTAANGFGGADDMDLSSAYMVFDITEPEDPPKLLAEFRLPDRSFSMVYPAVATIKDKVAASDANKWFLVFGSGPNLLDTVTSTNTAKLYAMDLKEWSLPASTINAPAGCSLITSDGFKFISCDTGVDNTFLGSPVAVDWNLSYKTDTVYFGVAGAGSTNTGKLMRLPVNQQSDPGLWQAPSTVIATNRPVSISPLPGLDNLGNHWLYFGTGRFLAGADKSYTNTETLYGLKDPYNKTSNPNPAALTKLNLANVTDTETLTNGNLLDGPAGITKFTPLVQAVDDDTFAGWYLDLPPITGTAGVDPASRVVSQPALLGGVLFATAYQPSVDSCQSEGFSQLYGLYYKTGTAYPDPAILGTKTTFTANDTAKRVTDPERGRDAPPAIYSSPGQGADQVAVFTQLSLGQTQRQEATTPESVRSGKTGWRELE